MLDHIGIKAQEIAKAKVFYDAALAPLGGKPVFEFELPNKAGRFIGYGTEPGKPRFWIQTSVGVPAATSGPIHLAFRASSHAQIDAFYKAALKAGGRDNGKPGPRPHYHANYYGAFVIDPDGNNVEAVCHKAV
jgi:catechol 2,3-dioxygenase-like lactoylglutathione lyase family enzyme